MTINMMCPISGSLMRPVFSEIVLGKYDVGYYYSEESGLLKTEKPYWLDESYQDAISCTDTGLVARNNSNSKHLEVLLECLYSGKGKFLDIAGGYGLLTRLLRDKGFDCYTTDRYCANIFAKSFEPSPGFKANAMFAFEVLEHLEDPFEFLNEIFDMYECRTLIFSTVTFSGGIPPNDWWYFSFETGQHISFYQSRTLSMLAERLGCKYFQLGENFHIITDIKFNSLVNIILFNKIFKKVFSVFARNKRREYSKTWSDHLKMKAGLDKRNELGTPIK